MTEMGVPLVKNRTRGGSSLARMNAPSMTERQPTKWKVREYTLLLQREAVLSGMKHKIYVGNGYE